MTWQDSWENAAADERAQYDARPVSELITHIQKGWFGTYYTIWHSIAMRAKLEQAGWPLFDVLRSNANYLNRYHCAAALLRLLGNSPFEAVHLSADIPNREHNLEVIERELINRLGTRET
jgi:hypothetical protein